MRRCVGSRNLVNEEALAHWGAVAPETTKQTKVGCAISLKVNSITCLDFNNIVYLRLRWPWRNYVTFCCVSYTPNPSDPPLSSYIKHEKTICHNPHNSPNWVSRVTRRLVYKHTFCQSVVSTNKQTKKTCSIIIWKTPRLRFGLLRICQVFSVSCKTVYWWVTPVQLVLSCL